LIFFFPPVLETELRASHMVGKFSTTEFYPLLIGFIF
jgi:hypothetical protein